jgi:nitrogen fixation/metabolism regulation signal transduction histidine kinase
MNSNKYYYGIIVRVILIVLSSLLFAFLSFKTNYLYTISSLFILVILQTWNLIKYILKRRDDLKRMLEYIKESNPTMYFSPSRIYPFNELGYFLNEIGDIVREVRIDKENQLRYTQYIVQHVGIGLLAFDQDGKVEIVNQAAKDILNLQVLNSIDVLDKAKLGLTNIVKKMSLNEQKVIILNSSKEIQHLAIKMSIFKIAQREIKLISFQDIKNELDEKEMDSWQKLIRVLTHEIINSITPVTSLTGTIAGFFKTNSTLVTANDISDNTIQQTVTGLELIEERGKALLDFVNKFRSLTKLPTPKFEEISIDDLITGIEILKKDELTKKGISLKLTFDQKNMSILCDKSLIEHVLINLINNAADTVSNNVQPKSKTIEITSKINDNKHQEISIKDNGNGIPEDLIEEIFIPFFTTKENGSGIGLSLSRQIMRLHGGKISAQSVLNQETVFTLTF